MLGVVIGKLCDVGEDFILSLKVVGWDLDLSICVFLSIVESVLKYGE